jgi:hypothetical protein
MPDWNRIIRERLGAVATNFREQEETFAELAGHLEDVYEDLRAQGKRESEAMARALSEISDGCRLGRKIQKSKEGKMNERTRQFWLPGLISVAAACALLAVVAQLSYMPRVILLRSELATLVYPVWLLGQMVPGALGAYLSRRAGGNRLARLTAGLFPVIIMVAGIGVVILVQMLSHGRGDFGRVDTQMLLRALLATILIPAVVLALGTLPFLRERREVS